MFEHLPGLYLPVPKYLNHPRNHSNTQTISSKLVRLLEEFKYIKISTEELYYLYIYIKII